VGRSAPTVEQPGRRQDERPGADRHQPVAAFPERDRSGQQFGLDRLDREVVASGDYDRIDAATRAVPAINAISPRDADVIGGKVDGERGADRGRHGLAGRRGITEPVIRPEPVGLGKDLGWPGDVEHLHAVED